MRTSYPFLLLVGLGCGSPQPPGDHSRAVDTTTVTDTGIMASAPEVPVDSLPYAGGPIMLVPVPVHLAKGLDFELMIPERYELKVAAEGFKRLRFMAWSPAGLLITDMHDLTDNRKGRVHLLTGWNEDSARFTGQRVLLDGLRNPNQVLHHAGGDRHYLVVATTDKLLRHPVRDTNTMALGEPQVLDTFPSYGLSYKYGGWHLTRSLLLAPNGKLYVSVGSSCNACIEQEEVRATILEMDPDGGNRRIYATGLRNAVGLRWVHGAIYATEMGSDQFGTEAPEDKLVRVVDGSFHGWPYFYQVGDSVLLDTAFAKPHMRLRPPEPAYALLGPHVAPLGLDFLEDFADERLRNAFVVCCHGSSIVPMAKGYAIMRVHKGERPVPVVTGFLQQGRRFGRPCDVMAHDSGHGVPGGPDGLFFTDDLNGVLYLLRPKRH